MIGELVGRPPRSFAFGPFVLIPERQLLLTGETPVRIGARALEILTALVERPGEVVSKRDLIARVWPNVFVEEGNLKVNMAALRRALGPGPDGADYIATVIGRGYRFTAPVHVASLPDIALGQSSDERRRSAIASSSTLYNLPPASTHMRGRDASVAAILEQLRQDHLVTLTGPGGIGKTTVAIAIGNLVRKASGRRVSFVDFSTISDPSLACTLVASSLGLLAHGDDLSDAIVASLEEHAALLILDNCEHVLAPIARLAQRICAEAPAARLLATSREPLRIVGETVHRLPPLDVPDENEPITIAKAMTFSAVQVFVQKACDRNQGFALTDFNARIVAGLCRRLDGIPLAIELVAGRVDVFGVSGAAALLNERLAIARSDAHTLNPRHQTLSTALDWSYNLLSEHERTALRVFSVFIGAFTLDAARAALQANAIEAFDAVEAISGLVSKSLLIPIVDREPVRYRLLETTRDYGWRKLLESAEGQKCARWHASYFLSLMARVDDDQSDWAETIDESVMHLDNLRAALRWAFEEHGDVEVGARLTAATAPLLLDLSLLGECAIWTARAIQTLKAPLLGSFCELQLQTALASAVIFGTGSSNVLKATLHRGLTIAEELGETRYLLRLLELLRVYHVRLPDLRGSITLAERALAIGARPENRAVRWMSEVMNAQSQHLLGDQLATQRSCEAALAGAPSPSRTSFSQYDAGMRHDILSTHARALWLRGFPDRALDVARQSIAEAEEFEHPITLCSSTIWTTHVFIWAGDWESAEDYINRVGAHADMHAFAPGKAVVRAFKADLAMKRGDAAACLHLMHESLAIAKANSYESLPSVFACAMAEALAATGKPDEGLAVVDRALSHLERCEHLIYLPEFLRVKASILAALNRDKALIDNCLRCGIKLAQQQSALSWELRNAITATQLSPGAGREQLTRVLAQFTEGRGTADLVTAKTILERRQN